MGMNEPRGTSNASQINPENAAFDEKWRCEYIAFLDLLPELLRTHRDKFVAIHGGAVVAEGDTFAEVALRAYERVATYHAYCEGLGRSASGGTAAVAASQACGGANDALSI